MDPRLIIIVAAIKTAYLLCYLSPVFRIFVDDDWCSVLCAAAAAERKGNRRRATGRGGRRTDGPVAVVYDDRRKKSESQSWDTSER